MEKLKWNYIDIQIYSISLWNIKCNHFFLFVIIIMSAAINKFYRYGSWANDYIKTHATLGFSLHHSPCSLRCWTNNSRTDWSLYPNRSKSLGHVGCSLIYAALGIIPDLTPSWPYLLSHIGVAVATKSVKVISPTLNIFLSHRTVAQKIVQCWRFYLV